MALVYFFREKGRSSVKVGMTGGDVYDRFNAFKTYCASEPYIVGVIETDDPHTLERQIHKRVEAYRLNGEFFEISDEYVLKLISEYNPMYEKALTLINKHLSDGSLDMSMLIDFINRSCSNDIITDGQPAYYSLDMIKSRIKQYMEISKLTTLTASAIELKRNLFRKDQLRHSEFIKCLNKLFPLQGNIRYASAFTGNSVVGRAYRIGINDL